MGVQAMDQNTFLRYSERAKCSIALGQEHFALSQYQGLIF